MSATLRPPNLAETLIFIRRAHDGQYDKGGNPYYLHPVGVMARLPPDAPEEAKHVALLHDVLEDTAVTETTLTVLGYSPAIVTAVKLLTRDKSDGLTYQAWIDNIIASGNRIAMMVKLADNEDNADPKRIAQIPERERDIVRRYERSMAKLREALRGT